MKKAIILVLIYFGMQILGMFLAYIPCVIYLLIAGQNISDAQTMMLAPSLLIGMLLMGIYLWKAGYINRSKANWSFLSPAWLALTVVFTCSAIWLLDMLLSFMNIPDWLESSFDLLQSGWLGILGISVLGPVLEELLFRGAITRVLLQKYSPVAAIFFSALIFGLFHINPVQVLGAFLIGLFLAWMYYRTGSLIPCILVHIINNSLSVYLNLKYPDAENITELVGEQAAIAGTGIALVLLVVSFFLMRKLIAPYAWKTEKTETLN